MKKNAATQLINTVTAKALARKIHAEVTDLKQGQRKQIEARVKKDPRYKKMRELQRKEKLFQKSAKVVEEKLEAIYGVDLYSDGTMRVRNATVQLNVDVQAIATDVILMHNVEGKSIDTIRKELIATLSK